MVEVGVMSIHLIIEFIGVRAEKISKIKPVKRILDRVISRSGLKKVSFIFHQFKPFGVSAVYLLKESHLSIHTWPELSCASIDIFTCGNERNAVKAFNLLVKEFEPEKIKKKVIRRILYEQIKRKNFN